MVRWMTSRSAGPIGIDLGARSVKLVQFNADCTSLIEAARWDAPLGDDGDTSVDHQIDCYAEAIRMARGGRGFRGRNAVLCLSNRDLFLQSIRVPKVEGPELDQLVHQEAAGRIPFPVAEAEIRYLEAADIRQGDTTLREIILLACHRPLLENLLESIERAGLTPVAVDVEPSAMLRSSLRQFRRDADQRQRTIIVHIGFSTTAVMIAQGDDLMFVKYVDLGGRHFDEAVARRLKMSFSDASALRRHNGDRRSDQQDPVIARSVSDSIRPIVEQLISEVSMCIRYNSVTFRGQPIVRLLLGGGEATPALLETLDARINLKCQLSDPLRGLVNAPSTRLGQWDIAAGLALRFQQ